MGYAWLLEIGTGTCGFQEMLEERRLAVAAEPIALGLAVGLSIRTIPQENRLMGDTRRAGQTRLGGYAEGSPEGAGGCPGDHG